MILLVMSCFIDKISVYKEVQMRYKFDFWRKVLSVLMLFSLFGCGGNSNSNIEKNSKDLPVVIIGPSTVYIAHELNEAVHEDKSDCRLEGWGERLYEFANDENAIYNYARPGSSSASFFESPDGKDRIEQMLWGPDRDHYWDGAKEKMRELEKGLLLIQYGANEKVTDEVNFKNNIRRYIDEAKELNFTPILITEIEKRIRNADKTLKQSRGDYPKWMKEVGEEKGVRVLDLNSKSYKEYSRYTDKEWDEKFAKCWSRWGSKNKQDTHFEPKGAKIVAGWIKELACEDKNSLLCKQLLGYKKPFKLSSDNFIPDHNSPSFSWQNRPKYTKSFALIIDDHDAKDGDKNWVHWVVFNIDKNTKNIKQNSIPSGAIVEQNSLGAKSYVDPAYPDTHKYVAYLYALDIEDITKAQYANQTPIYKPNKIYDHKEFEKVFGNFILEKSVLTSK
jgi:Raf kinase inhibitor-like YbhB/YbcL family protein